MKPSDRRLALRFSLNVTLYIRAWKSSGPEQKVESVNLSESGVYFETDSPPPQGAVIHLRLEMPHEITGTVGTEWSCIGKVVRVIRDPTYSQSGVGVHFAYYEVLAAPRLSQAQSTGSF